MELVFRKYFWAFNLLFLLLAAWLLARTANVFVESKLYVLPDLSAQAVAFHADAAPKSPLTAEALSKVTGVALPPPMVEVQEPAAKAVDLSSEPVKSGLRVRLVGTMIAVDHPEWSLCSIEDTSTREVTVYMVGDSVQQAKILEIQRQRVIVLNDNRREYIDAEAGMGAPQVAAFTPPPVASGAPPSTAVGAGIRALSENEYELPRSEIDKTLGNLNDVAMQARIVPSFKNGQANGFKLFSIRPDSIYTRIGVQNGDVIRRINGYEMNSPEKALEIYTKLKEASRIEIEIERNGAAIRKSYSVR